MVYLFLVLSCCTLLTFSQAQSFTGYYVNTSNTIALQLKPVSDGYHGLMSTAGGNFALKAVASGDQLLGTIYAMDGPASFTATATGGGMVLNAFGASESFLFVTVEHALANVDLTPYFQDSSAVLPGRSSGDYDYSYSQHSRGSASESYQSYESQTPAESPYPALDDSELRSLVAGSQVVYYTRTSYLNDATASSITYVNFCRNGNFSMNYDGSFAVEGYYGDNAQGATHGQNSGTWQLVEYKGQPAVFLAFYNGNTSVNPVNKQRIREGRWRIGNTQYAVQRNKVICD